MSILIKGMEMPTKCSVCPMLEGNIDDGLCHAASRWLDDDEYWIWYEYPEGDLDSKPANCPLVELPPHGRLIDADALTIELMDRGVDQVQLDDLSEIQQAIADTPTIIEAEDEA